jgi:hypothetical protein
VDLTYYKFLLTKIAADLLSLGDKRGGRVFLRWSHMLHELHAAPQSNERLIEHAREVQRNARAVVTLASGRQLSATVSQNRRETDLPYAVESLVQEAALFEAKLSAIDAVLKDAGLPAIVGQTLTSITFNKDRIQFGFGRSILSAITQPKVRELRILYDMYNPGFCDALCRRIGVAVIHAEVKEKRSIIVHFRDKSRIRISLRPVDREGSESATFSSASGCLWIW